MPRWLALWIGAALVLAGCPARPGGSSPTVRSHAALSRSRARAAASTAPEVPVAASSTKTGRGFWVAATNGSVTPEGDAVFHGDASASHLAAPVVGIASTPSGDGYWLLGGDGGVFTFGDARFYGSTGGIHLDQPALQMVPTPTGRGYWFVARDGGVFSFGDAHFYGSTGGISLHRPIIGMAAVAAGGYWLVARDGGVFSFGRAGFHGSLGDVHLAEPIVGLAATRDGGGYWMVARDGGVFTFGDAHFYGSAGGSRLPAPAIGMVATGDGRGYWVLLGNGQVRAFGDAAPVATTAIRSAGFSLVGQVVTIDPGHNGGNGGDPAYIDQPVWNGRSLETCDTVGAATDAGYTESAFNFDVATRLAALLRQDGATVVLTRSTDSGVGPCITERAAIGNRARSDVAVSIHADGGPPGGSGFTVLEPVADGPNDGVIGASLALAVELRNALAAVEPVSDYYGVAGLEPRSDLGGLNLTTVPKVLVESANMRNAGDAARLTDPGWRQAAAASLARGLSEYLIGYP